MKKLIYRIKCYSHVYNEEKEELEKIPSISEVTVWNPTDNDIAKAKESAYDGEYTIVTENETVPIAPRNIVALEYITVNGILYKATANIPNGEPIINGQNAVETTVEEQLAELAKGE